MLTRLACYFLKIEIVWENVTTLNQQPRKANRAILFFLEITFNIGLYIYIACVLNPTGSIKKQPTANNQQNVCLSRKVFIYPPSPSISPALSHTYDVNPTRRHISLHSTQVPLEYPTFHSKRAIFQIFHKPNRNMFKGHSHISAAIYRHASKLKNGFYVTIV